MIEDYVSFEVAKLLKEKGFDSEGVSEVGGYYVDYYHTEERIGIATESMMLNKTLEDWEYLRPTIQMAIKWLREKHSIFIDIMSRFSMNADKDVCFSYSCKKLTETYKSCYEYKDGEWLSYEEAAEAAIKYCLENLI